MNMISTLLPQVLAEDQGESPMESALNTLDTETKFRFGDSTLANILSSADGIIFFLAGFALMVYLILGGFQLMTSGGSPDAAAGGKAKITSALIGFVIIFTAYWIVQILGRVLGLQEIISAP